MGEPHYALSHLEVVLRLLMAFACGAVIGLNREFHQKPAGFRTFGLVSIGSAVVVLMMELEQGSGADAVSRVVQGVLTGIGFLGAGVIFKEGLSVRGLTTAASIWITAAVGILYGVGFYYPAILATLATIGTLALFRWIEERMPSQYYALHVLRFARAKTQPEAKVRKFINDHGFSVANMSYRLDDGGKVFEYRMSIRTIDQRNITRLVEGYRKREDVLEFRVSPTGD
jgi:putative Mg2+ transporter-C (MgtC) family protein